jgi:hypothetical protein
MRWRPQAIATTMVSATYPKALIDRHAGGPLSGNKGRSPTGAEGSTNVEGHRSKAPCR